MSLFCRTQSADGQSTDCSLYFSESVFRTFRGCLPCSPEIGKKRNALWFVNRASGLQGYPIGCKGFGPVETNINLEEHQTRLQLGNSKGQERGGEGQSRA